MTDSDIRDEIFHSADLLIRGSATGCMAYRKAEVEPDSVKRNKVKFTHSPGV